jgi:hypothetical protein
VAPRLAQRNVASPCSACMHAHSAKHRAATVPAASATHLVVELIVRNNVGVTIVDILQVLQQWVAMLILIYEDGIPTANLRGVRIVRNVWSDGRRCCLHSFGLAGIGQGLRVGLSWPQRGRQSLSGCSLWEACRLRCLH